MWRGDQLLDAGAILEGTSRINELHNVNIKLQVWARFEAKRMHMQSAGRLALLRKFTTRSEQLIMFALLHATRNFEASDPRDKLFALVGLASDLSEDFVDYSKDLKDRVTELSRLFLSGNLESASNQLDLLSCITRPGGEDETMPSWVVDWTLLGTNSLFTSLCGAYPSEAPYVRGQSVVHFQDEKVCKSCS